MKTESPLPEKEKLLALMPELAAQSADIIRSYFHKQDVDVDYKEDNSPVTVADREAEAHIRKEINTHFPTHGIIGEEYGEENPDADYVWVIDPVDGTKSFIHGVPLFGTIMGLRYQGKPALGCIHIPMLNILCIGDNLTATCNGEPIQGPSKKDLSKALLLTSDVTHPAEHHSPSGWDSLVKQTALLRTWGDAYGYAQLATGWADIMVDPIAMPWDFMGVIPIVQGAGCRITDWNGEDPAKGSSIVAAPPALHAEVLEILKG